MQSTCNVLFKSRRHRLVLLEVPTSPLIFKHCWVSPLTNNSAIQNHCGIPAAHKKSPGDSRSSIATLSTFRPTKIKPHLIKSRVAWSKQSRQWLVNQSVGGRDLRISDLFYESVNMTHSLARSLAHVHIFYGVWFSLTRALSRSLTFIFFIAFG